MKKSTVLIIISTVLLVAAGAYYFLTKEEETPYQSVTVEKRTLERVILSTGEVKPRNRLEIKPAISGRVEEVLVREGEKVTRGQRLAWMSSTERAALIDAARSRGESEVERWSSFYRPTALISPIDGMVIARMVEPGQSFSTQDILFVLSDTLGVKALVDETDLADITLNQQARIILDAYPNRPIEAEVQHIAYESKTVNNVTNYEVDVIPFEPVEVMRSGMTANVSFILEQATDALTIPVTALISERREHYVLIPEGTQGSVRRLVQTGLNDGRFVEVLEGVSLGETILVPSLPQMGRGSQGGGSPFVPQRGRRR